MKKATRSGTPTIFDPDARGNRPNPYRKDDDLKGEGWEMTDFGEQDYVGGGNTKAPATLTDGVSADPRANESYGLEKTNPVDTTILDDINESGKGDAASQKSIPGTDAWENFISEDSPLSNVNDDAQKDKNPFQAKLNNNSSRADRFSDIINMIQRRQKQVV